MNGSLLRFICRTVKCFASDVSGLLMLFSPTLLLVSGARDVMLRWLVLGEVLNPQSWTWSLRVPQSTFPKILDENVLDLYQRFPPLNHITENRGAIGAIAPLPLKPTKVNFFTIILYNSENSIRGIRPF